MTQRSITTSFRISEEDKRFLDELSKKEGKSPSEIIRTAIGFIKSCAIDIKADQEGGKRLFHAAIKSNKIILDLYKMLDRACRVAQDTIDYFEQDCRELISESDFNKLRKKGEYAWLFSVAISEAEALFQSKGHISNPLHPSRLDLYGFDYITEHHFAVYKHVKDSMGHEEFEKHLHQKTSALVGVSDDLFAETVKSMVDRLKANCKTKRGFRLKKAKESLEAWLVDVWQDHCCHELNDWRRYLQKLNMLDDIPLEIDLFSYFEFEGIYDKNSLYRPDRRYEVLPWPEAAEAIESRKEIIEALDSIMFFNDTHCYDFLKEVLENLEDKKREMNTRVVLNKISSPINQ